MSKCPEKLIDEEGIRLDGRKWDELRPIKIKTGVARKASGSAYIEQGRNRILVAVYGPRELHPRHKTLPNRAVLRCRYRMAPFSTETRKSFFPTRREIEISKVLREALEPIVFSELYPRTTIDIFIEVLRSDGSTRCSGLTAASVALADAGIPIRGLIAACAIGKIDGQIVIDLTGIEDQFGEADMPVAVLSETNEIVLLQMDGMFSEDEFKNALELALNGCKKIHEIQKRSLREKYQSIAQT
jgi:exosome complex component RRP41